MDKGSLTASAHFRVNTTEKAPYGAFFYYR